MLPEQSQYCDYNSASYHQNMAATTQEAYYNGSTYFPPLVNNQNVVNGHSHRMSNDQVLLSYDLINGNRALINEYDQSYILGASSGPLAPAVDKDSHLFNGPNGFKDLNNNGYAYGSNMLCSSGMNPAVASYDKHLMHDDSSKVHKKKQSDHKSKSHSSKSSKGASAKNGALPMVNFSNFSQNPSLKTMFSTSQHPESLGGGLSSKNMHQNQKSMSQQKNANRKNKMHGFSSMSNCQGMGSSSSHSSKRKRKRVLNRMQRAEATMREKRRMLKLNKAFEELRKVLPISEFAKNKLSRAETLKSAIEYIDYMTELLSIT